MRLFTVIWAVLTALGNAFDFDYEEHPQKSFAISQRTEEDFEPVILSSKDSEKLVISRDVVCENFLQYSSNCTLQAALIYNSSRKTPPLPEKLAHWCRAIRQLTNCAIDWNTDCEDLNDNRFDDDSIKGHKHVIESICDDEWFLTQYAGVAACIIGSANAWEACYNIFKDVVDVYKNTSKEQTHFENHFYLCCARARFRRCSLDSLFAVSSKCTHDEVIVLQKFSTIVSEGDVFQNCDFNMNYHICPGGDPRPTKSVLAKLVAPEASKGERAPLVNLVTMSCCFVLGNVI